MHCQCCDRFLNDYESTRKSKLTGEYLDTCSRCLDGLGIETTVREDLNPFDEADVYDAFNEDFSDASVEVVEENG